MISVVICTYNREKYLPRCLDHLLVQDAEWSSFEVLVVDNKSTDNTKQILSDFIKKNPDFPLKSFFEPKPGLSNARNTGIELSSGDVIAFIDDDAFPRVDFVSNIKAFFGNNQGVDGYGGRIEPLMECDPPGWMSPWLMPLLSVLDMGNQVKQFGRNGYPVGANMGFTRLAANKVGKFNSSLGRTGQNLMGSEEKDYFFRMRQEGMKIFYVPNVVVHHVVPASRLSVGFIRKQAFGIGASEKARTKNEGRFSYFLATLSELNKWIGSVVLTVFYIATFRFVKAKMLIKFRVWVSRGLMQKGRIPEL